MPLPFPVFCACSQNLANLINVFYFLLQELKAYIAFITPFNKTFPIVRLKMAPHFNFFPYFPLSDLLGDVVIVCPYYMP